MRPQARSIGLLIRELPDELVVYDTERHQAHCLNRTSAIVFRQADGTRTVGEIAAALGRGGGEAVREALRAALDQLRTAELLVGESETSARSSLTRRHMLRQVGRGAAVLAPVVISLLVPPPAAAQSCIPETSCSELNNGQPCYKTTPAVECPFFTCQSVGVCA